MNQTKKNTSSNSFIVGIVIVLSIWFYGNIFLAPFINPFFEESAKVFYPTDLTNSKLYYGYFLVFYLLINRYIARYNYRE